MPSRKSRKLGQTLRHAILQRRIHILNRKGKIIDWDNDDLSELIAADEQPTLIHSDIISEIPDVETGAMYDGIIWPIPIGKEEKAESYAEHVATARTNSGLDTIIQAWGVNKKQDDVIVIIADDDDVNRNWQELGLRIACERRSGWLFLS